MEDFYSNIHQRYWSVLFFSGSFFGLGLRVMLASQNVFGGIVSSSFFFLKNLKRINSNSSLNVW